MFYDNQPIEYQKKYKNMLKILGGLSRLFSESESPYLYYRAHENIFSKYFEVNNNARHDDSADAYDSLCGIGIGLKTWVGQDNQKVAEFGRLRPQYAHLSGLELIKTISQYRNTRIRTTKNAHGLKKMLYHIVKRVPGYMRIYESAFDEIDIEHIVIDEKRGSANSTYFTDGKHTYHFSQSKNTLYMVFDDMELLDEFEVKIYEDPYDLLSGLMAENISIPTPKMPLKENQLCLRLYSTKADGTKFIPEKSGLNQWNGSRKTYKINERGERKLFRVTPRDPNELYIPYPAKDRRRKDFFPPRDENFDLMLPDGQWVSAKVCQQDSKAIMTNPNKVLGKWLLRDVFELAEGTQVTYDMLRIFNVDSVIFTKIDDHKYTVDFCELGTYERFYNLRDIESKDEENDLA